MKTTAGKHQRNIESTYIYKFSSAIQSNLSWHSHLEHVAIDLSHTLLCFTFIAKSLEVGNEDVLDWTYMYFGFSEES